MALEGLQLGQYRLLRLLGSGGMGEVYLAEDARIGQQVAVKVNRTEATPYPHGTSLQDAVRLFQREARAVAKLDHPHILPLFSYGEEHVQGMTLMYIVMPHRPEGSFANWLQQRGDKDTLSVRDMAYFMNMAADALQHAHHHQIVHQDVKPSNFLIRTNQDPTKLPDLLLTDFGIARWSTATSRVSHILRGTPLYMAPEQWNSEAVPATDQYALAVLAYELLTGHPPFMGQQQQVMYQHFHVQPQPPSARNAQLSQTVDAVILKALAKRPEDRFPSITAFADAFKQATTLLDASTISNKSATPRHLELQVTLAISKAEAQLGTNRTLTLPGGRRIAVSVPAGAYNGQVLRLSGMDQPFSDGEVAGTLILLLSVQETEDIAFPTQHRNFDETVLASASNTPDQTVLSANQGHVPSSPPPAALAPRATELHHSHPVVRQQGISTGTAILLVGLVLLLLVGGLGFFYLTTINRPTPTPINSVTLTPTGGTTHTAITAPTSTQSNTPIPVVNTTSSGYVQLKSYYSGTASGYANAAITFTLKSEDQQGNISMQTTFQLLGGSQKTDSYACQGTLTTDRHLNLQCSSLTDASYLLTIQGYAYPDGHLEGTETATNTNDAGYHHVYAFQAY